MGACRSNLVYHRHLEPRHQRARHHAEWGQPDHQKSGRCACGTSTGFSLKGSILFSAQIVSSQTLLSLRQRLVIYMGSLNVSSSSILTKASRNLLSAVTLKRSVTCSFSVCGVRNMSR